MTGSVIITGANGSVALYSAEHLLQAYPDFTAVFTVRDTSDSDVNTKKLREIIARFPKAKASIHKLDLASLESTQAFADTFAAGVASGQYPPIAAIVANAYYWDLVKGPELTGDGFDKTIQINHISHAALVLRLLGSFADGGRVILLSSDSHWPGKNSMEKYPPGLPTDLEELVKPPPVAEGDDLQGRGYQRYATSKLAMTAWAYALNRYLEKGGNLKTITAIAMNPGNFPDSRALTRNTPPSLQKLQKYFLRPLLPILKFTAPTLRGSAQGGFDVVELAISPKYAGEKGFYTMLAKDESSPESQDEAKQQSLWAKTLEWARITKDSTALKVAFE
ncbi:putative short-chain dehydrogenase [Bombardia bombarda]|uniref:Short-chain dehydrogenase n=1 Tax=Bombardia bombarda TaxID=252184 RepID=A0AA40BVN9_9PEZI|nr:putative short-chain dehydrogenase [Bombardia bombarda]